MNSLPDRRRLLAFSETRQRRSEQAVLRTQQQLLPLHQALAGFVEQEASLRNLLASHRAEECVLDHGQLLALLRRQAVIRRQIDELHLERDRVDQQCRQLDETLREQQQQLRALQLRHGKYQRAVQQLLRVQRLERVRREEREVEDMTGVRR
jgi:chromosome segregation ATPase